MRYVFFVALTLFGFANYPGPQEPNVQEEMQEADIHVSTLENGVKTYLSPHFNSSKEASLRVVVRKSLCAPVLYAFEGPVDSVDEFLLHCRTAMDEENGKNTLSKLSSASSEEMAIVAVGDFSEDQMQQLIQKHFSSVRLEDSEYTNNIQVSQDEEMFKVALHLNYALPRHSLSSESDLRERWKSFLIHDLFQNRLECCARFQNEDWVHPHPRFLHPVSGYALVSEEAAENLLFYLLWQAESVCANGFTQEEFSTVKNNLLTSLNYLSSYAAFPDPSFIAAYYADQFLMDMKESKSYSDFLCLSQQLIEEINCSELNAALPTFFDEERRGIHMVYPLHTQGEILTVGQIEELCDRVAVLSSLYHEEEMEEESDWIIDVRFVSNEEEPKFYLANNEGEQHLPTLYYQLSISESEKHLIEAIVNTIAEKNVFQLAFEKRGLEKKGKKVNGVHPLRFIGHIFSNPALKKAMRSIRKSSFKWDGFLDGYSKRMRLEYEHNNLFKYVVGFSEAVHANPEEVNHYIRKKDWEGLLIYLM